MKPKQPKCALSQSLLIAILCMMFFQMTDIHSARGKAIAETPNTLDTSKKHYFVQLLGTRPGWPDDMTPKEERIMGDHFQYLKDLVRNKEVLMAGPCFDPIFGLVILQTETEERALEIMDREPSVIGGVHTYKLHPMHVSLLAEHETQGLSVMDQSDRILRKETIVSATRDEIWHAWTTTDGVKTFFSPEAHIELAVLGPYEIYFSPDEPYGLRGSEGCRILSYLPQEILSFEWNAPPSFGDLRGPKTRIVIQFEEMQDGTVKVTLSHVGWGTGEDWEKLYDYFDSAWSYVLDNLEKRFTDGPIDWSER